MESVARYLRRELQPLGMQAQTMSDDRRLLSTGYPANVTIRGIRFAMLRVDHLRDIVEVLVTHPALDRIEALADGRTDYLGRFDKHKERFERIRERQVRSGRDRR